MDNPMNEEQLLALSTVLDFVERWNKQDKDINTAHAQGVLDEWLTEQASKE
jgi:hypothetical protein